MNRRTSVALVGVLALCAPACALASNHTPGHAATSASCNDTAPLYCIPKQSTFAFTGLKKSAARCSIEVDFAVEPEVSGASGHASLQLLGVSRHDKSVHRSAHPAVVGAHAAKYAFARLRPGTYKLTGWYEGDSTRAASTHVSKLLALRCG
jgi:hypothetical protein